MAITRSQTTTLRTKKEEDCKDRLKYALHSDRNSISNSRDKSDTRGKIRKKYASNGKKPLLFQVKKEEESDDKSLLQIPKRKACKQYQSISKEQIEQLIHCIVKDGMSVTIASEKTNVSSTTGYRYYNQYLNDPERKIPLPCKCTNKKFEKITQDQINKLFTFILDDKMPVKDASVKVNIKSVSGRRYYNKYLKNPSNGIPLTTVTISKRKLYTQDQIKKLIQYITDEEMSIHGASEKANIAYYSGQRYYNQYLKNPSNEIPIPGTNSARMGKACTQDQINELFGYILDDKISINLASVKCNMSAATARRYYNIYLKNPSNGVPISRKNSARMGKACTQDQIKTVIKYITDDQLSLRDASKKANVSYRTAQSCYRKFLENSGSEVPVPNGKRFLKCKPYTQDQINTLFKYILDDKVPLYTAAAKCNMSSATAKKYYYTYWNDPNKKIPILGSNTITTKPFTQDQINRVITYIVDDKMPISVASIKANMGYNYARKYYLQYLKDPHRHIPALKKRRSAAPAPTKAQVIRLIDYVNKNKISISEAAKKLNMHRKKAHNYYYRYRNCSQREIPEPVGKRYPDERVKKLIDYVKNNKLTVKTAAKRVGIIYHIALAYYKKFKQNPQNANIVSDTT